MTITTAHDPQYSDHIIALYGCVMENNKQNKAICKTEYFVTDKFERIFRPTFHIEEDTVLCMEQLCILPSFAKVKECSVDFCKTYYDVPCKMFDIPSNELTPA